VYKAVSENFLPLAVGYIKKRPQAERGKTKIWNNLFLTFCKDLCCSVEYRLLHSYQYFGKSIFFGNASNISIISLSSKKSLI